PAAPGTSAGFTVSSATSSRVSSTASSPSDVISLKPTTHRHPQYCGAVVAAIAILVISLGAILAGRGYVRTARRMQSFATTRGHVTAREVVTIGSLSREGKWGQGGNYRPKVTYDYTVGGVAYTSDRVSYANRGLRRSLAEQQLAAFPDEVDVYYDPAAPQEA